MGDNLLVLGICGGVGVLIGAIAAILQSQSIRRHGPYGALRRRFSGGSYRSHYLG